MNTSHKSVLLLAVISTALFSCQQNSKKEKKEDKEHHGINLSYMDTTVSPKQDFYNFVNGTWMKEESIPEDRGSWGSFNILRKNTDDKVQDLLDEAMKDEDLDSSSDQAKAVYLYQSELDTSSREDAGFDPIKPAMEKIASVENMEDLQKVLRENPIEIANPFIGLYASAKPEESTVNGAFLSPGSLGLPERDYYTNDDSSSKKIREQYVDHISRMLQYWGDDEQDAQEKAQRILELETKLAEPRLTKEEQRDVRKLNNPRSIDELASLTPTIQWKDLLSELPVKEEVDTMIVTQLNYMEKLDGFLKTEDIEDLKTLISWQTINSAASQLTPELERADWEFYSKTLHGTPEQRPAEERALNTVNGSVGEALGQLYVDKEFPPEAKDTAETMVHNILEVYKDRIKDLEWMTDDTKDKAIEKVEALTVKIGYPDEWKDYSDLEISEDNSYYENLAAASKWRYEDNISRINQPVDTLEWHMNPQTVNAYFNPSMNEIVFPAAILQAPFFDYKADAAVNFGGIGAVIGHEISHAFDDSGARYDAQGNVSNWWTNEDLEQFEERTNKLIEFYNKVKVEDSLHLNGEYTAGENAADLGGLTASYYGLQRFYETHGKPDKIDGFDQEQRFFMSWATVWRTKTRDEALRSQIKTDPHAPGMYRAYLPLQNIDEFYDAFDIEEGDEMFVAPEERVKIW